MTCAGVLRRRRGVCSQTRRAPVGATMTDFRRISRHRPWAAAGWRGWRGSAPVSRAAPGHWWPAPRVWRWPGPAVSAPCTPHPPRGLVATPAAGRPTHAPPSPAQCGVGIDCGHRGLGWAGLGWAGLEGGITLQLGPNFPAARPRAVSHVHCLRRAAESAAELRRTSLQTAVAPAPAQLSLICETDATRRWCRFAVGSRCGAVRPGPRTAGPGWLLGGRWQLGAPLGGVLSLSAL